jgi:hypothetical protein
MAENFDLIFGQNASQQYAWSDNDYQKGWETVGNIPPTASQFDALQRRNDTKMKELNDNLTPLVNANTAETRQPATAYNVGDMKYSSLLPTGWLLSCVVAGTTSAGEIVLPSPVVENATVLDGTVTWEIRKIADTQGLASKANITGSNLVHHRDVITTSGTYTAPVTGLYKITVKGGGAGGAGGAHNTSVALGGRGGGEGGTTIAYEKMTAGQTASVTIGAGGAGGAATNSSYTSIIGTDGGDSSVSVNGNTYVGNGGSAYGPGGAGTIPGAPGGASNAPSTVSNINSPGSSGGGNGGRAAGSSGTFGGGGNGGTSQIATGSTPGSAGGDGYVWFEYYTPGA